MRITLQKNDIEEMLDFAKRVAPGERDTEWGDNNTQPRELEEKIWDTFIGKLGEKAFEIMLEQQHINAPIDVEVYDGPDNNDIRYNGWHFDIKCTANPKSRLLMVPLNEIDEKIRQHRNHNGIIPHGFILTKITDTISIDDIPEQLEVEICGGISIEDLLQDNENVRRANRGELLFGRIPLDTANYIVDKDNLIDDWENFTNVIRDVEAPQIELEKRADWDYEVREI